MIPHHTDIFPLTLPTKQPPPVYKTLNEGHPTPIYGLAWVCTDMQLLQLAGDNKPFTPEETFTMRWNDLSPLPYNFRPQVYFAMDGNNYLVAMFNTRNTDHQKRVADPNDDLIEAARGAFSITSELERSFMWYRFPLNWVDHET